LEEQKMAKSKAKSNKGFIFLIILSILTAALTTYIIADGLLHRSSFLRDRAFISALSEALEKFPANITHEDMAEVRVLFLERNVSFDQMTGQQIQEGFILTIGHDEAAQFLRNTQEDPDFVDENAENYFITVSSDVDIQDFSSLAYFTNLELINISSQPNMRDIRFMENMDALRFLSMELVDVANFSPIADLTGLETLTLAGVDIDVSLLAGLDSLESLVLVANNISDISGLAGLVNLTSLNLSHNEIEDISVLSRLTSLERLMLENNNITDINALSGLVNLTDLRISENEIYDIQAVASLSNLETLLASSAGISDISALSGLSVLETLILNNNYIYDISPVYNLRSLDVLSMNNNNVSDISPLEPLGDSLVHLALANNAIEDISTLESFEMLESLNLDGNLIEDWEMLNALVEGGLVQISGPGTQASDMQFDSDDVYWGEGADWHETESGDYEDAYEEYEEYNIEEEAEEPEETVETEE